MQLRLTHVVSIAAALLLTLPAAAQSKKEARPDFSGYWALSRRAEPDPELMKLIAPNTVVLDDVGAAELPIGDYGGLKVKPKALEAAKKWKPADDMTLSNACKPPSIVYATQGPFPMEIYQGTEFIIFKHEYYDLVRIVFMDGRKPSADQPHSKTGFSTGRWEGSTLVVETTHLSAATITNNGLEHSDHVRVIERFRLSEDGKTLLSTMEFEDPEVLENRGARFIAWNKQEGHVYPYECDPTFAQEYNKDLKN
jgi:hypothetical protein